MPANEKRGYVMMSDFWQYIAEYTIADFSIEWSYLHSNAFVHFFYWKNVVFAQSNKCCELCKTKCQPMRSVMWWRRISDTISQNIPSQIFFIIQSDSRPWWLSWILNRLETRRSRVQPLPRFATFFRGDWWWNIFYGHSLPSADSRRADVSFWRKNVHNTG